MLTGISAIAQLNIDVLFADFGDYPRLGEENAASRFAIELGGGPQATLLRLHQMDIPTRLGTFYTDDVQSRLGLQLLDEFGYSHYENLYTGTGHPSVVTSVFSFPKDRAFITYNEGVNSTILPDDEVYTFLKGSRVCYAPESPAVLQRLQADGTLLVYDSAWHDDLSLEKLSGILQHVDVFTPNDKEALKMTGAATPEEALQKLSAYVQTPIVKIGKKGCLALVDGKVVHVPEVDEFIPVDSTGAGDSFLAGVMYGLYHGWGILDCIGMGNVLGGNATTQLGCLAAPITQQQALAYFEKYYGRPGQALA